MDWIRQVILFSGAVIPNLARRLGKDRVGETFEILAMLYDRHGGDVAKANRAIPDIVDKVTGDRAKRDEELAALKKKAAKKKSREPSTE